MHVAFLRNSRTNDATKAGITASSKLENTRFGSLGLVFPYPVYQGSLVFAAGFNQIKDLDWNLREPGFEDVFLVDGGTAQLETSHSFSHEGGLSLTALAGAVDVSPSLSLGLTVGFVSGEDQAVNEFNWIDSEDLVEEDRYLARDSFDDEYKGSFYTILGAMIRAPREAPKYRLGVTIAAGSTREIAYTFRGLSDPYGYNQIEYDDGTNRENVAFGDDGELKSVSIEELRNSYKLSLPIEFSLGASVAPVDGLLLAGSLHFAEWKQSAYEGRDEYGLRSDASFEDQYRNTVRYHLGVEWQVPTIALDLRAGFYTDPLPFVGPPYPDLSVDPVTNPEIKIDQDRRFFTLGAGLQVDRVIQLDLAWARGHFEQTEGELTEDNTISRLFAAVAYRF